MQQGHELGGFSTATAMLDALRTRKLSAVELLDLHFQRIDRYNPELNAIVVRDDEQARRAANAADGRARGSRAAHCWAYR